MSEIRRLLPHDLQPITSLEAYIAQGGMAGLKKARAMTPDQVIDQIKAAGLRGRGGAGFPTWIKWSGVKSDPCPTKYVVCNGSEGEPGTYKDRYLLSKNPYTLLEGIAIAVYAIGAQQGVIGLKEKYHLAHANVNRARTEMIEAGYITENLIEIVPGPDEYLFGEEKGLLEFLDHGGAMPRNVPPFIKGLRATPYSSNPTVINNIETFNHAAHILAKGPQWFREVGTEDTPGTVIFTVCGDVKRPGMYELPLGLTVRQLLYDIAGGPVGEYPIKAVLSGVANRVMLPHQFDNKMDFGSLKAIGCGLGSAGFIVYDESASMVKVTRKLSNFLGQESCGQCVPCKSGGTNITELLAAIEQGKGTQWHLDKIEEILGRITNQTRCFLPEEEKLLVSSMLAAFPQEFKDAINGKLTNTRTIVLPKINDFNEVTREFSYHDKWP